AGPDRRGRRDGRRVPRSAGRVHAGAARRPSPRPAVGGRGVVSSPYIETGDGPVAPDSIGWTLTHEHVFLEMWGDDGQGFIGQTPHEGALASEPHALAHARRRRPPR